MKKLILIISILLLLAGQAFGATYYVSQSGSGDGSAVGTPDSIADFNAGAFGELDDDTVYFLDRVTQIRPPDSGTNGHNVILRGDYPGQECTAESIIHNSKEYITIQGFTILNSFDVGTNWTPERVKIKYWEAAE